jgi:hypothetical protein
MPWIIAAAAIGSTLLSGQQQAQASGAARRQSGIQSQSQGAPLLGAGVGQGFEPTAPNNTPPSSGSNTLNNVNQAVQLGAMLQGISQNEIGRGQAARQASMASMPRPPAMGTYQPTAYDPRLRQALGLR